MAQSLAPQTGLFNSPLVDPETGIMSTEWRRFFGIYFGAGVTGTFDLAKITGGGTNGSVTIQNGLVVAFVAPT